MSYRWVSIFRLGLVQMCLGAIVVLTTSTLNRLMVVELALPAVLPGLLVGLHYGMQITRPNWGFLSDAGGRRTRWIIGGMVVLALGGFLAALGRRLDGAAPGAGPAAVGAGLCADRRSASGPRAPRCWRFWRPPPHPRRRAAAATITWLMMIFGIAVTAGTVGHAP